MVYLPLSLSSLHPLFPTLPLFAVNCFDPSLTDFVLSVLGSHVLPTALTSHCVIFSSLYFCLPSLHTPLLTLTLSSHSCLGPLLADSPLHQYLYLHGLPTTSALHTYYLTLFTSSLLYANNFIGSLRVLWIFLPLMLVAFIIAFICIYYTLLIYLLRIQKICQ